MSLLDQAAAGKQLRISPETAGRRARDLETRLAARLEQLTQDETLSARMPVIETMALVLPAGLLTRPPAPGATPDPRLPARDTAEVERRAVDAVLAAERQLGRDPHEEAHNNPGFDITSLIPGGGAVTIEVKGRILGADSVFVTRTELLVGKTKGADHRLALVAVHPDGPAQDEVRYVTDPFADEGDPGFFNDGSMLSWARLWAAAGRPE